MSCTVDDEIERMFRVTDLMITAHSILRDRFRRRALALDVCLLVGSAALAVIAVIEPSKIQSIIGQDIPVSLLGALVGLFVVTASIVQLRVDWQGMSVLHGKAVEFLLAVKHELGRVKLEPQESERQRLFWPVRAKFELSGTVTPPIPEKRFLTLKREHRLKVECSKMLDSCPGTWPWLARVKVFVRDNFRR